MKSWGAIPHSPAILKAKFSTLTNFDIIFGTPMTDGKTSYQRYSGTTKTALCQCLLVECFLVALGDNCCQRAECNRWYLESDLWCQIKKGGVKWL